MAELRPLLRLSLRIVGLCVALTSLGCGDDGGGNAADAGDEVDASDIDGAPVSTTCGIVADGAVYAVGTPVLFSTSSGDILGIEYLDVDGRASRDDCGPDTMLTLRRFTFSGGPSGFTGKFATIAGVQGGDTVVLSATRSLPPVEGNVNVSVTASVEGFPGATNVLVQACPGGQSLQGLPPFAIFHPLCPGDDNKVDAVGYLLDDGTPIAAAYLKDVDPVFGGTTQIPLGAWQAHANPRSTLSVSNPSLWAATASFRITHLVAGAAWGGDFTLGPVAVDTVFDAPALPSGFGESTVMAATLVGPGDSGVGIAVQGPYIDSRTLDFSTALPRISGVATTQSAGRATLEILSDGPLDNADFRFLYLYWDGGTWSIYAPGGGTFVTPTIPDSLQDSLFFGADRQPTTQAAMAADWENRDYQALIKSGGLGAAGIIGLPNQVGADDTLRESFWRDF